MPGGELIPVLYTQFPVRDAAGGLIGFGTVTRDNRERKHAEKRLILAYGELGHRSRTSWR